jgi:hypothetical protein
MLAQRVYGLAPGCEDLNDRDQLLHDPLMGMLAGHQKPDRPLASKSTLCWLGRTPATGAERDRYKKIRYDAEAIDPLLLDMFTDARPEAPDEVVLDLDVTDTPLHGHQYGRFLEASTTNTVICRCTSSAEINCCPCGFGKPIRTPVPGAWRRCSGSCCACVAAGRR